MTKISYILSITVIFCNISFLSLADKIFLRNGKEVQGEVLSEEGDLVYVRVASSGINGVSSFSKNNIASIEKGPIVVREASRMPLLSGKFTLRKLMLKIRNMDPVEGVKSFLSMLSGKTAVHYNRYYTESSYKAGQPVESGRLEKSIASSVLLRWLVNIFLVILTLRSYKSAKAVNLTRLINRLEQVPAGSVFRGWLFFVFTASAAQCIKFGSFNCFVSGGIAVFIFLIIIHETLVMLLMLLLREKYIAMVRWMFSRLNPVYKIPIMLETILFGYLVLQDILVVFL